MRINIIRALSDAAGWKNFPRDVMINWKMKDAVPATYDDKQDYRVRVIAVCLGGAVFAAMVSKLLALVPLVVAAVKVRVIFSDTEDEPPKAV